MSDWNLAAASALYGLGKGLEDEGKRAETTNDKAEKYYLELMDSDKFELKNERNIYKKGMTLVQVRQLFKELSPQERSNRQYAMDTPISAQDAEILNKLYPDLSIQEGTTRGTVQAMVARSGQLSREGISQNVLESKGEDRAQRMEIAKQDMRQFLVNMQIKNPMDFKKALKDETNKALFNAYLMPLGFSIQDLSSDGKIANVLRYIGVADITSPQIASDELNTQELLKEIKKTGIPVKDLLEQLKQKNQKKAQQTQPVQTQKLQPAGVTETPGMEQQLQTSLTQPGMTSQSSSSMQPQSTTQVQPTTQSQNGLAALRNKLKPADYLKNLAYLRGK